MDEPGLQRLLADVRSGALSPDEAVHRLRRLPFADLGFARVDHHRSLRQGLPEAVYGQGKSAGQCSAIVGELLSDGDGPVILTRADAVQVELVAADHPGGERTVTGPATGVDQVGRELPRWCWRGATAVGPKASSSSRPALRTSPSPRSVWRRCAPWASRRVVADFGVAGVHRLLAAIDDVVAADAVVVVAGMEGALASVVGGLTGAPVVAVPAAGLRLLVRRRNRAPLDARVVCVGPDGRGHRQRIRRRGAVARMMR